jgi:hypothetical protein
MNTSKLSLVPLQQASLCLDCDMISAAHTHCFGCGSAALLNLARTLDGRRYSDLMPRANVTATNVSPLRAFEPISIRDRNRQHRPIMAECLPFPQTVRHAADSRTGYKWSSLREVAAIVHRAMTVALLGFLVQGTADAPTMATGHFSVAGDGQTQTYSSNQASPGL